VHIPAIPNDRQRLLGLRRQFREELGHRHVVEIVVCQRAVGQAFRLTV